MALLGMIAIRLKNQKLIWDSKNFKFTNNEKANELLHKTLQKRLEFVIRLFFNLHNI
jgi:hypothetical protein